MKRCKVKGCKKQVYIAEWCKYHYYYFRRSKHPVKSAEVKYHARFLKREIINAKEYERFRKIWNTLDARENEIRHRKSIVENIMRKYLKSEG